VASAVRVGFAALAANGAFAENEVQVARLAN
jgi:hypothetical protein